MTEKPVIWMFPKWYPNNEDPQLGVFIQKHAEVIAQEFRVSVLYVHFTENEELSGVLDERFRDDLHEIILYVKKSSGISHRFQHLFSYRNAIKRGLKLMKRQHPKPDLFHAYILLRTGILASYLSFIQRKPYMISEQWSGYATGQYEKMHPAKKYLYRLITKRAGGLHVVSNFLLNKIHSSGIHNKNEFVIGNAIDFPALEPRARDSKKSVLIVADLVDEIKNISGVLSMINELSEDIKRTFSVKIIGGGKDEKYLKALATEFNLINTVVFFEGQKTNPEVYSYLKGSDFLIMNSRFETFSSICAEAMSCGKPVIATDCGGPGEFVNSSTGILIQVDQNEQLKTAFLKMLNECHSYDPKTISEQLKDRFSRAKIADEFKKHIPFILSN